MFKRSLPRFLDLFSRSKARYRNHIVPFPTDSEIVRSTVSGGEIVAFFTTKSIYEREAERMVASAARLGLSVRTTAIESAGSWVRNAALKPTFLLEARANCRGALLYVDVDAVFHRDPWPTLLEYDCDIAVFREAGRLISATILFNDTQGALDILAEWKKRCDQDPEIWDQVVLQDILDEDQVSARRYKVVELPPTYCWIFDRLSNVKGEAVVIEQLQASRQANDAVSKRGRNKSLERREARIASIEKILGAGIANIDRAPGPPDTFNKVA